MVAANDFGFGFPKGCLIIFEPLIEVEDQDFVLACMKGGKTSFRQFFSSFRTLKLMPLDNRYPGDVLTPDELGKNGVTLIVAIAMESSLPALSRSSSRLQKLIT